jgi:hypothetical protein
MRLAIFMALVSSLAAAQTFQGVVRGRILDPNGGTVSAVIITLIDEGTSVSRRTTSNDQGRTCASRDERG